MRKSKTLLFGAASLALALCSCGAPAAPFSSPASQSAAQGTSEATYVMTFLNYDGSVLWTIEGCHYGDAIVYDGPTPAKPSGTLHYGYPFRGWDKELKATGDVTFSPIFGEEVAFLPYKVRYESESGDLLFEAEIASAEASVPAYAGEAPSKGDKGNTRFTFSHWEKASEDDAALIYRPAFYGYTQGLGINGGEVQGYSGTDEDVYIPEYYDGHEVTSINNLATWDASGGVGIAALHIPQTVEEISLTSFLNRGFGAFEVDPANAALKDIDGVLYDGLGETLIRYPDLRQGDSYRLAEGAKSIFGYAFYACSLKSIALPASFEALEGTGFSDAEALEKIEVDPNSPYCKAVDGVLYSKDGTTIASYPANKSGERFALPSGVAIVAERAFANAKNLKAVVLGDEATSLGQNAFMGCKALESIDLGGSLAFVGSSAFMGCSALKELSIPSTLTEIGSWAFAGCYALSSIFIPISVEKVGANLFGTSYYYGGSDTKIYCEASSKPEGWDDQWNSTGNEVVWGYSLS